LAVKRKRFFVEQIVEVLQRSSRLIRQAGISEQTLHCWKKQ
jgi:putative transposase